MEHLRILNLAYEFPLMGHSLELLLYSWISGICGLRIQYFLSAYNSAFCNDPYATVATIEAMWFFTHVSETTKL